MPDITEEERKVALHWLDRIQAKGSLADAEYARTATRLLSLPVLPEEPDGGLLGTMFRAAHRHGCGLSSEGMRVAYQALYAHLTKPRTKTVEVWHVEWALHGSPMLGLCLSRCEANDLSEKLGREPHRACIRVTGPHQQLVPDDD